MDKGIAKSRAARPRTPGRALAAGARRRDGSDDRWTRRSRPAGPSPLRQAGQPRARPSACQGRPRRPTLGRRGADPAFEFDDFVILEEFVVGRELELARAGQRGRAGLRPPVRSWPAGSSTTSRTSICSGVAKTVVPTDLNASQLEPAPGPGPAGLPGPAGRGPGPGRPLLASATTRSSSTRSTPCRASRPISMFPMLWEAEASLRRHRRAGAARAARDVRRACCAPGAVSRLERPARRACPTTTAGPTWAERSGGPRSVRSMGAGTRSATIGAGAIGAASTLSIRCGCMVTTFTRAWRPTPGTACPAPAG